LKVVSVWDTDDARGLLKSAVRDNNPTLVLESERMYGVEFDTSDEVMDPEYLVPIGKARTHMEGNHVTLLSHAAAMTPTL
jgi:pyruvate dehydrogenase E1 component beta subunit